MADDRINLTVLEDGTAKLEIPGVSGANHVRAEALLKEFARLMGGGPIEHGKMKNAHHHHHEHGEHTHTHKAGN
jgi:hypothetical protein